MAYDRAVVIAYGTNDGTVPIKLNGEEIEKVLKSEGTQVKLTRHPNAGHGFIGDDTANKNAAANALAETVAFIDGNL